MELQEALTQIHTIRAQVTRTELFRGYRAATVAGTGVLGLAAAAMQPMLVPDPALNPVAFVDLWVLVALASVLLIAAELTMNWYRTESVLARQQTRRAIEQFLPCLVAGGLMTWALWSFAPQMLVLLPGLWAIVFGLGMFASARQLPPAIYGVGAYYLVAGTACLGWAQGDAAFSPWAMGGTFGIGQLLTAAVLYWTLERPHAEE